VFAGKKCSVELEKIKKKKSRKKEKEGKILS